jgi:penicillin amidase
MLCFKQAAKKMQQKHKITRKNSKFYTRKNKAYMKSLKRIIYATIVFLVIAVLIALFFIYRLSRRGLPDYNSNLVLKGLEHPVKIYHDEIGIPHIYAASEHDLYMATGFVMAQERLWQMDLLRRVTLGRLSEIFGDDFIKTDLLLRSLRYSEKSGRILEESSPALVSILQAFSDGVNSYIEKNKGNYPVEFFLLGYTPEKWKPLHSLNLIGYMAWDLKSGWNELILEKLASKLDSAHMADILPDNLNQKSVIFKSNDKDILANNSLLNLSNLDKLGLDVFCGSNNWAVAGKRSVTGKPILANDMHLSFNIPGTWFQIHQVVEGSLSVTGLSLPGQPLIIVGHNDSIAWGMTNTYVDNLDYYEEKINPDNPDQYLLNGVWKNFEVFNDTIISKGGAKNIVSYRTNHRGPVVSGFKGIKDKILTIRWVGDLKSNEFQSIYLLNKAHNWLEFKEAFRTFRSISQNVAYADVQGNIGLYCCAGVPVRKRDKFYTVLPGWTDEYDWKGLVPFDSLPFVYNPDCGYVISANNKTTGANYPYHIGTWYSLPYRYNRIEEMILNKDKLSINDFKFMQNDMNSHFAKLYISTLVPLFHADDNWTEQEKYALTTISTWDFEMSPQKIAPTIFELWTCQFVKNIYSDEMDDELYSLYIENGSLPKFALYNLLIAKQSIWTDNVKTKNIETLSDIASESFKETVATIIDLYGTDTLNWRWGNVHKLTLSHPLAKVKAIDKIFKLNRGPFAVGGSSHTVSPYSFVFGAPGNITHGASHRNIFLPGDWDNSCSVIPTGNSGICSGEFYCNQTELYIEGGYHPDLFTIAKVKATRKFEMNLLP